jgi:uncharacterized protein YceK
VGRVGLWGAAVALVAVGLAGCGTINSYASGCPAPYSGVRVDDEYLDDLGSFGEDGFDWVTISLDLPLSAILDTLTLPIALSFEQAPPAPVSPGCGWAANRAQS